ncbi:hypothetical protein FACS189464_1820 [Bacteroidia bacterium]|nr:hypothetical protein FACS189464_1820 [Bacteroidia bacterium]
MIRLYKIPPEELEELGIESPPAGDLGGYRDFENYLFSEPYGFEFDFPGDKVLIYGTWYRISSLLITGGNNGNSGSNGTGGEGGNGNGGNGNGEGEGEGGSGGEGGSPPAGDLGGCCDAVTGYLDSILVALSTLSDQMNSMINATGVVHDKLCCLHHWTESPCGDNCGEPEPEPEPEPDANYEAMELFCDQIADYEYDAGKLIHEDIPIQTSSSYPGTNGIGFVEKVINPNKTDVLALANATQLKYWGVTTMMINGKSYRNNRSGTYGRRLPNCSIATTEPRHSKGLDFLYTIHVPESREYIFISATDNYVWVYVDGNLVFQKSDDGNNTGFNRAWAYKVYLTKGVHSIKNQWQDDGSVAWGTVMEVYDCSIDDLLYDYATIEEAEAFLQPHRIFTTGDFFTDVNADGATATGVIPNVYIDAADIAAGWEPVLKDGSIIAARRLSIGNSGFQAAKYLRVYHLDDETAPVDIDGEKCSESGRPQAIVVNAAEYAGKARGQLLTIASVTYQISDAFDTPDDLYTNERYRTQPVRYKNTDVIRWNENECPLNA